MNIQGYQKLTLLDYPQRTACTVFTGGCNLRCPFCHNAGLVRTPMENPNAEGEVLDYLKERKKLIDGVCITGGEPLLQPGLMDFIEKVKALGYLVKLDTNGTLPKRLDLVIKSGMLDFIAMDIKSSPKGYEMACGGEVDVTLVDESISLIKNSGIDHEFRTTAVKGIHTLKDFESIGSWLCGEKKYYIQKFTDSGNLIGCGVDEFSRNEMLEILKCVQAYIPTASLRGVS